MRRPSPYETRARELAVAAGLDPDRRVARPCEIKNDRCLLVLAIKLSLRVKYSLLGPRSTNSHL